jgi:hypothetical protein
VPCSDDPRRRLSLPLTDCQREDLKALLNATLAAASQRPSQVTCEFEGDVSINQVSLPTQASAPLQLVVGGESQAERFVFRSRPVAPTRRGLYGLILNEHGEVLRRHFEPLSDRQQRVPEAWFDEPAAHEWIILRHVGGQDAAVIPSIEVYDQQRELVLQRVPVSDQAAAVELDLTTRFCR